MNPDPAVLRAISFRETLDAQINFLRARRQHIDLLIAMLEAEIAIGKIPVDVLIGASPRVEPSTN